MKSSLLFGTLLLFGTFIGCSKDAQPLTPAQSLLGKWKVISLLIDEEEEIDSYKSIVWEFKDYNGQYGHFIETTQWLVSNFDQISSFYYTADRGLTYFGLYNDEKDAINNTNGSMPNLTLVGDTLTLLTEYGDEFGPLGTIKKKAYRLKQ